MDRTPADPGEDGTDIHRRQEMHLAAVVADGPVGAARVFREALHGEPAAAGLTLAALLRALPTVSWLTAHDLLTSTGATESTRLAALTPGQRTALALVLARVPAPPPAPA